MQRGCNTENSYMTVKMRLCAIMDRGEVLQGNNVIDLINVSH